MKVVISENSYGINLSPKAFKAFGETRSELIVPKTFDEFWTGTGQTEQEKWKELEWFLPLFLSECYLYEDYLVYEDTLIKDRIYYELDYSLINVRTHIDLVWLVETLGEDASLKFNIPSREEPKLKVVEVPDDVEWTLEGDDSGEWVAEKHRTWR
ncbi:MAG TPA: hypothetical protein PLP33_27135 [Leptospiraceae bacterium]|nr:hypothetical protein [Leptospiraceae bacterium]